MAENKDEDLLWSMQAINLSERINLQGSHKNLQESVEALF